MSSLQAYWGLSDGQWTRSGLTLAEGLTLCRRLLASPLIPESVFCLPQHEHELVEAAGGRCAVTVQTQSEMEKWAGFPFHRGVVAIARRPEGVSLESFLAGKARRLAVAPKLTDPENLGALFRSALALGWDAVAIGDQSCDPFSRRCAKVSMGAVYSRPPVLLPRPLVCRRLLEAAGWVNLALALGSQAESLDDWCTSAEGQAAKAGKLSVWVGNEFQGLSPEDLEVCHPSLVLPMAEGHDSLNASVAAGIALYRLGAR